MTPRSFDDELPGRSRWASGAGAAAAAVAVGLTAYTLARARQPASPFPRAHEIDGTVALLREGYDYIGNRCRALETDVFETRLMGQRVICTSGEDAARMFYVPDRFTRRGAIPMTALMLLQDWRSVQLLDGNRHRHRKRMFLQALMEPARVRALVDLARHDWATRIASWAALPRVVVHDEAREVLCRAVCAWAGVPLAAEEVSRRAREFGAMIDGSGRIGARNLRGQLLRMRMERWMQHVVTQMRDGVVTPPRESAARTIVWHRDPAGDLLPVKTAAIELINVLRPTVAVARYITFAVMAMHRRPEVRERLRDDPSYREWFVQEVRRFYPFFPAVGGRVRSAFTWRGHTFAPGAWVLLDLYGTNHDRDIWGDPDMFRPERFAERPSSPFTLIPQGGGSHAENHRCPGEDITIALTSVAIEQLARARFDLPPQDLHINMAELPALPASGVVLSDVRPE